MAKAYDVAIIGGGVSGTSLLYVLSNFTSVGNIVLLEKHDEVAQVSSHYTQNSQTLHEGDIETNYTMEKARKVSKMAALLKRYLNGVENEGVFKKSHKMALAVGSHEVRELKKRFDKLTGIFQNIRFIDREEIAKYEPKVVEGREPGVELGAIFNPEGYIMNYHQLARSFLENAKEKGVDVELGTEVLRVRKDKGRYVLETNKGDYRVKFLACDAGAMSVKFAKQVGYGKHLNILSLAGNFYRGPEALKGKVYTWQHPKRPNAAIHGDPDVKGEGYTRYGPTAKTLFMLERWNYSTVSDYFKSFNYTPKGIFSVLKIGFDPAYFWYMLENTLMEIPIFGNMLVARHVKKIVPNTHWWDLKKDKGYGGARPQIVNTKTHSVELGEARIKGDNAIFNITPSPGASTCLANAERDAKEIVKTLGKTFYYSKYKEALGE